MGEEESELRHGSDKCNRDLWLQVEVCAQGVEILFLFSLKDTFATGNVIEHRMVEGLYVMKRKGYRRMMF